jgi:hypothetical protein
VAHDETTTQRVRQVLAGRSDVVEKRMIGGGLGFMVNGHLCCGVSTQGLTVRVGPEVRRQVLAEKHTRPLRIGDREPAAFVVVTPDGYQDDSALHAWIERGLRYVASLQ